MPSNTCSNLAESAFKHLVQIFFFIQIFVDNFEFAYDLSILHTTNGITHEVYAAPICVPVCKWYINRNNRQLANSSTTLDKASFSSTWLQPLAIMTASIVFMKYIQGNDKFSLTIIIIIPYEPLPLRLVIR